MNRCAYLARQELKASFERQFKNRNNFVAARMVYKPTSLSEWPKLRVRVGSAFKAMEYQLEGGTKEATQPTWLGIPMRGLEAPTRRGKMPQQLLKRKGYAIAKTAHGYLLVYRPKFTKKQKNQRRLARAQGIAVEPIKSKIIYGLHKKIHFKPRWDLGAVVERVFEGNYFKTFKSTFK